MSLTLVSAFRPENYAAKFDRPYNNPYDPVERADMAALFKTALAISRPKHDYKIFDYFDRAEIYFQSHVDANRFDVTTSERVITMTLFQATPDYALYKLNNHCNKLRKAANRAGFGAYVNFEVDPDERSINVYSEHKAEYFRFMDLATDNGIIDRYAKLMAKIHGRSPDAAEINI